MKSKIYIHILYNTIFVALRIVFYFPISVNELVSAVLQVYGKRYLNQQMGSIIGSLQKQAVQ